MTQDANPRRYSFLTVSFEGDAGLLNLQARSMRLYCPPELVKEIIVVDNSSPGAHAWQDGVLRQYGSLSEFVRFLPAAEVAEVSTNPSGWFTQQILKIKAASFVASDHYVILDGKDHLIRELTREFLETASGQLRTNGYAYADHPMREFLENTLTYLNIDPKQHLEWFIRTTTPFTMVKAEACDLVRDIEAREGRPFASVFLDRKLSEFFLYSGYLASKGKLHELYEFTQPNHSTVWPYRASESACAEVIEKASRGRSPFLAVHRRAIDKMERGSHRLLGAFWHERGLFASAKDGIRFLENPVRSRQQPDGRVTFGPLARIWSAVHRKLARVQQQVRERRRRPLPSS